MEQSATRGIRIETKAQKWRYRCPNNHASWDTTNNHFWCPSCAGQHDMDPEYWEILDTKTGERIPRDRIKLEI